MSTKARKPALGFIFITLLLDILGFGLIIPILPKLIEQLQGGNTSSAAHMYGWLTGVYALMQFLFASVLGSLSDRFGRRPVILVSLFGSAVDFLFMALAPNVPWFFLGRVVNGISGANITTATAYIADISPPEKRAANFGIVGAAFGVGFILGPAMGGWLGEHNLRLPFFVAAGLTFANWLYGFFILPESLAPENRRAFSWKRANPVGSLTALGHYPIVLRLAISLFLINIAQFMLHSTWALYTAYRYDWSPKQIGLSLAFVGLMTALVQGGLTRRIIPKLGERRAILIGFSISAVCYLGYAFAPYGWTIYVVLAFGCLAGIGGPATQGLISRNVPANEQGAVQGALTSLSSLAQIIAPLASTNLFGWFIGPQAPAHLPGVAFILSSVVTVIALVLAIRSFQDHAAPVPAASVPS
ncbi:MAG TPA: TCR/Tet family MFS transporter [Candidatus Limnocylindria bacterium]|jgi:DHA1 family tetracycline resistance protein-like MFS transporter|nr:TCR/Tet family MFS transporter [Candidatus Limnocylindria bacterium]